MPKKANNLHIRNRWFLTYNYNHLYSCLMLTLAINTSSSTESVALLDNNKLLAERVWHGNADESEKLLPAIVGLLKSKRKSFQDLKSIIAVRGPGPFSAVRIGITITNILGFALNIPIYSIDALRFWELRRPSENSVLLLHAGGHFVHMSGNGIKSGIYNISDALKLAGKTFGHGKIVFFGDITEKELIEFNKMKQPSWRFVQEDALLTFGLIVLLLKPNLLKQEKIATPAYWLPPNITKAK